MIDSEGGFLDTFESLAQTFVVAAILWWLFLLVAWPFIAISRIIFFIFSFGHIRPKYREALKHQGIVWLAFIIFLPGFFYLHIVYGAEIYGNRS